MHCKFLRIGSTSQLCLHEFAMYSYGPLYRFYCLRFWSWVSHRSIALLTLHMANGGYDTNILRCVRPKQTNSALPLRERQRKVYLNWSLPHGYSSLKCSQSNFSMCVCDADWSWKPGYLRPDWRHATVICIFSHGCRTNLPLIKSHIFYLPS